MEKNRFFWSFYNFKSIYNPVHTPKITNVRFKRQQIWKNIKNIIPEKLWLGDSVYMRENEKSTHK